MKVVFPHNESPTGFGVGQVASGALFALSPCCGFALDKREGCANCGEKYTKFSQDSGVNLDGPIPLGNPFLRIWAISLLGIEVDVEIRS